MLIAPPTPKGPTRDKLCAKCPFRRSGGYIHGTQDLENIRQTTALGLPFYCHETALLDPRTSVNASGDPDPVPQSHFELCRGAREHQLDVWREKVRAAGHEPGEP